MSNNGAQWRDVMEEELGNEHWAKNLKEQKT